MNRIAKQIFIAAISLVFLGGVIYVGVKAILPEGEVDQPVVEQPKEDIKVLWTKLLAADNENYNLVAQIENPNVDFGAKSFQYDFVLYNSREEEIAKKSGMGYIMPDEKKYIIEMFVESSQSPAKISLRILDVDWNAKDIEARLNATQAPYHSIDFDSTGAYSEVTGIIENQSSYNFDVVEINIVLYDQSGNVVSVNKTGVNTLLAQEKRAFKALWYEQIFDQIGKVDVVAKTNVYDQDNLIRVEGEEEDLLRE